MRRRSGFTLMELIIAVAITALVMAMVGGILVSVLTADEQVTQALNSEKVGYGVVTILRRDLEACYSYALGGAAFQGQRGSEGATADRVSFVASIEGDPDPQTGRRPKFQRIGYRLKQETTGNGVLSLYRYAEPFNGAKDEPLAPGTYGFIATGIKSLKLSYLDPKDKVWKDDEWKETDRTPIAVKVSVELIPPTTGAPDQGLGLVPAKVVESTIAVPTQFGPIPDQDPNAPGAPTPTPPR